MKTLIILALSLGLVLPAAAQVGTSTTQGREREDMKPVQYASSTYRKEIKDAQDAFQKVVEAKRTEMENTVKTQRDELKTKLKNIKDEAKKTAVDRIDQNITALNAKMTTHYTSVIDQIAGVLSRVGSRTDKAQANGKDVTDVRTAISKANDAIAAAWAAVVVQTGKVYALNVTTDAALKTNVGAARQALQSDLKNVEDLVKAARSSVQQAATTLAKIQGVDEFKDKEATSTEATSTNH